MVKTLFPNVLFLLVNFKVFPKILGLFFSEYLNLLSFMNVFTSVPKISFFLVSMYIWENSYLFFKWSSISINPIDLKILVFASYTKFSRRIVFPYWSFTIAFFSDFIIFLLSSITMSSPSIIYFSVVVTNVGPKLLNILSFSKYSAYWVWIILFSLSFATTSFFKIKKPFTLSCFTYSLFMIPFLVVTTTSFSKIEILGENPLRV